MGLKIGLYIPTLSGGGAQRVALNLAQGFIGHGCDVSLVLAKREGKLTNQIPSEVNTVTLEKGRAVTSIPKLSLHLQEVHYDTLISFMNYANICAVIASYLSRASHKLILTEHNTLSRNLREMGGMEGWKRSKLIRYLYPFADYVTAVSKGTAKDLERVTGLEGVRPIHNPILVNQEGQNSNKKDSIHDWLDGDIQVVLGAGRLTEQKGFSTLIKAFYRVRKENKSVRLIIIGEGEKRKVLKRMVKKLGIQKYVDMPGFVNNPFEYMKKANVFVLSSRWEGFGNVLVEAMACGAPVVATDCPNGPKEILEDGRWGCLVPVDNERLMAKGIIRSLNRGENEKIGVKKRAKDFKPYNIAEKYIDLILR
jgi:glycosyltransferase involved in cell wall biosynthesis